MILSLRRLKRSLMYIILFIFCTVFLYALFVYITGWIEPTNRYREPVGRAIKVFQTDEAYEPHFSHIVERLKLFMWLGE
ncbi:MAG: DUF4227 family protein [Bacilli bacterium]